jgi:hypothetical protein
MFQLYVCLSIQQQKEGNKVTGDDIFRLYACLPIQQQKEGNKVAEAGAEASAGSIASNSEYVPCMFALITIFWQIFEMSCCSKVECLMLSKLLVGTCRMIATYLLE